jgi:hypothetical protein
MLILIIKRLKSTQIRAKKLRRQEEGIIRKLINLITLLILKQSYLPFFKLLKATILKLILALLLILKSSEDNSVKELLLDALINKACRDDNILEKLIII